MNEKTLAIIKPDAVKKRVIGKVISRIEDEGFDICEMNMLRLTEDAPAGGRCQVRCGRCRKAAPAGNRQ